MQPLNEKSDEDYADYAEVSESDSQELARGLGLSNYPNQSQLRLLLVDSDSSQVGHAEKLWLFFVVVLIPLFAALFAIYCLCLTLVLHYHNLFKFTFITPKHSMIN